MMLLLLVLILLLGVGGYWGGNRWNPGSGPGIGIGTVLVVCLIIWLLGGFGGLHGSLLR